METIKTNVNVKEIFRSVTNLAPGLGYEKLEDSIDEAIRERYNRVLEYVTSRAKVKASTT